VPLAGAGLLVVDGCLWGLGDGAFGFLVDWGFGSFDDGGFGGFLFRHFSFLSLLLSLSFYFMKVPLSLLLFVCPEEVP